MLSRHAETRLHAALREAPVVLLHGARQVGKTTLVRDLLDGGRRRYITLDSASALAAAESDPEGFLAGLDGPVVIDEIQRAPGLLPAIKAEVDRDRRPGRFLLTGSANVLMLPRVSESLAGRMEIIRLWPLSQGEFDGHAESFIDRAFAPSFAPAPVPRLTRRALLSRISRGGFPEPAQRRDPHRRAAWHDAYVTTILQRDVRDLANIEDLGALPRLLRLIATRVGSLLSYAELSRDAAIPQSTLKRYFALLEATFLVHRVEPWSANLGSRLVKSPKIHLCDTGLAAHLLGIDELRDADPSLGRLLESFVVLELLKQCGWSKQSPSLFHFRTQTGQEVDVVLEDRKGRLVGIEIKASAAVNAADFKGIRALKDHAGDRFLRGLILHTGPDPVPFAKDLHAVPIQTLWEGD